jgi:hypothetical protein
VTPIPMDHARHHTFPKKLQVRRQFLTLKMVHLRGDMRDM